MDTVKYLLGLTFMLIVLYYFVYKADETSKTIKALSEAYTSSVRTLQGR